MITLEKILIGKGTLMILDIIIAVLLLLCLLYGLKKGFVFTLVHTVGWVISMVLAYFATPYMSSFMKKNTGLFPWIESNLEGQLGGSLTNVEEGLNRLSLVVNALTSPAGSEIPVKTVSSLAEIFFVICCFILAFVLIKVLLGILAHFISKDYRTGNIRIFDRILGGVTGLILGAILVILGLTAITFIAGIFPSSLGETFNAQLETSYVSKEIFENNALLVLLQNYIKI